MIVNYELNGFKMVALVIDADYRFALTWVDGDCAHAMFGGEEEEEYYHAVAKIDLTAPILDLRVNMAMRQALKKIEDHVGGTVAQKIVVNPIFCPLLPINIL